jgi:hypothetical protein
MDVVEDTVLTTIMEEDGYKRYERLHSIIKDIDSKPLGRTAEWYAEHYALLITYDNYFIDGFKNLHREIQQHEFRQDCVLLDLLLQNLLKDYRLRQWFSMYDYRNLNMLLIKIVDRVCEESPMEIDLLLSKLKL